MSFYFSYRASKIIEEICERVGMPFDSYYADALTDKIDGLSGSGSSDAYSIIEEIAKIVQFDSSSYDGAVNFIPRGLDSVATISLDDVIDKGDKSIQVKRRDSINTPRVLNLNYYDITGGTNTDKQQSDRSLDTRGKNESSSSTTVIMDADTAKRAVVIAHKLSIEEQRGEYRFELTKEWLRLTVGDCVIIDGNRLRITEVRIDEDHQKYRATFDRQSAYQTSIKGIPAAVPEEPPNITPADTLIEFIDSHIVSDFNDQLGFYFALTGENRDWGGANVQLSYDGGQNYVDSRQAKINSYIGETTNSISDHPTAYPDYNNTLTVEMARDDMTLTTATLSETMNRHNLALLGDELISFMDATQTSDTEWELSGLLRGRKGTETVSHSPGERFVVMTPNRLLFIPMQMFTLNRDLTFKVTSSGGSNSTVFTRTFTGESQKERTPAYLRATKEDASLLVNWQGVGRLGGGVNVGMGQFFDNYVVTLNDQTVETTDTSATLSYESGTLRVQQKNSITGLGEAISLAI